MAQVKLGLFYLIYCVDLTARTDVALPDRVTFGITRALMPDPLHSKLTSVRL